MFKKNLKKLVAVAMVVVSVISSTVMSYAYEQRLNNYKDVVSSTVGSWSSKPKYNRLQTGLDTAYGYATYVEFTTGNTLGQNFETNSDREVLIYLMEEDDKNDDDIVRSYRGKYTGRTLVDIVSNGLKMSGKIEAAGDKAAEFYIIYRVDMMPKDKWNAKIPAGHFQYRYGFSM